MKIDIPFNVFDYVKIKALNHPGRITCIKVSGHDVYLTIEYWWDGTIRVIDQTTDEVVRMDNPYRDDNE